VDKADVGDRIILRSHIFEAVSLSKKNDLIIEGEAGRNVTWKPPKPGFKGVKVPTLLKITNTAGTTIRGITMDGSAAAGQAGAAAIIQLWGECPGLVLENLKLSNYSKYGLLIFNCTGSADHPITFTNLVFRPLTGQPNAPGISFEVNPSLPGKENRWFCVRDCTFESGPKIVEKGTAAPLDSEIQPSAKPIIRVSQ
jgi:hypothetical protein